MKLLIAGSRGINEFDLSAYVSDEVDMIICGGAKGIDHVAEKYADAKRLSKLVLRPQYRRYGRQYAPLKRNEEMVELADEILVIWDGKSKGTKHTIDYVEKVNKPLRVVVLENASFDM